MLDKKSVGIKKRYVKSGSVCKVTFMITKEAAKGAKSIFLVGEFNDWSRESTPMERLKNNEFKVTLDLQSGKEYRYKYLIDDHRWENDWNADQYVENEYGSEDSVVVT